MNVLEPTSLFYERIERLPPEYITKIMGYLSHEVPSQQDMSLLDISPNKSIQDVVSAAKVDLQLPQKQSSPPISPPVMNPRRASDAPKFNHWYVPSPYQQLHSEQQPELGYLEQQDQSQNQFLPLDDRVEKVALGATVYPIDYYHYPKDFERHLNGGVVNQKHPDISEYPTKTCHYYSRGYCKHGNNCRFLHGQASHDRFSSVLGPVLNDGDHNNQIFSCSSLKKLETEIVDILKSRRGNPLSIASLPMIYYERYGKVLQAEGYLTESQRQGKAGHSLTRLLSRLGSIRLIDRPHGQHAVVLTEDAMNYLEGCEGSLMSSKSRQIYLTFRAESAFTEEDVSKYFSTYGPVEDVRIPCQHKRMFGFVTFVYPETVQTILAKGNPHYVCGSRVLVKPYKERSKLIDRKYQGRIGSPLHHTQCYIDANSELHSVVRGSETSRLLQYQKLMEEYAQSLATEKRHLAQMQLVRKHYQQQLLLNSMNALKVSEDHSTIPLANSFNYLDVLNRSSAEDSKLLFKETPIPDRESDMLNRPDSPLMSSIINSITNLIN